MKKNNFAVICVITVVIAIAQLIAGIIAIRSLPDAVPTHFNAQWVCDSVGSPWMLMMVVLLPAVVAAVAVICYLIGKIQQPKITAITVLLTDVYVIGTFWLLFPTFQSGAKLGEQIDPQPFSAMLPLLLSVFFIIIGNYMPIIQPNKTIGLRVPWTLNNEKCWRLTHRFAGKIWVICGLILCVTALVTLALHHAGEIWLFALVMVLISIAVIVPIIFAYQHRNDTVND